MILSLMLANPAFAAEERSESGGGAQAAAAAGAAAAAAAAAIAAAEAAKARAEMNQPKAAEETAKMMAQLAQMAAMLAAMAANKKAKDKAKEQDPIKAPAAVASASPTPENKQSPAPQLPTSSPAAEEEVAELTPGSPPVPVPGPLAEQLAEAGYEDEEVAVASGPVTNVPDGIEPRTKLGYDERGDGTTPNTNGTNSFPSMAKTGDAATKAAEENGKGRGVKGTEGGSSEGSDGGSSGADHTEVAAAAGPPDIAGMINGLLGQPPGAAGKPAVPPNQPLTAEQFAKATANLPPGVKVQIADVGKQNIFQFAHSKYQQLQKIDIIRTPTKAKKKKTIFSAASPSVR